MLTIIMMMRMMITMTIRAMLLMRIGISIAVMWYGVVWWCCEGRGYLERIVWEIFRGELFHFPTTATTAAVFIVLQPLRG